MFRNLCSVFFATVSLGVLAGCASHPYTPSAFQSASIDTTAYAAKVDAFAVILDASSSMNDPYQERLKFHIAKDLVANLNQTVPPLSYQGALVAFGSGSCTGGGDANVVYGLAPYQSADFAAGLDTVGCAGGTTPMAEGIDASGQAMSGQSGKIAVILVSDFWDVESPRVVAAVNRLKAEHGDLCLHTIKVGDSVDRERVVEEIASAAGCGSSVDAASLDSPDAMASYVIDVLLAPLEYTKHTVSATALFDFDKSVLKPQGESAIRELDDGIKSQGGSVADINVVGHTDSTGTAAYNQGLSERRAMAVKHFMVSDGIDAGLIDASGKGESEPVASNGTREGRALNRRVEVHVGTAGGN